MLVLVLGIGTVTAMFTIVYAVLLKPLPFEADRRLFQPVEKTIAGDDTLSISYDEIRQWREAARGHAEIAFNGGGLNIADGPAGALLITEVKASENLFALLGARPILGRGFLPGEAEAGNSDAVVLSYALWQRVSKKAARRRRVSHRRRSDATALYLPRLGTAPAGMGPRRSR